MDRTYDDERLRMKSFDDLHGRKRPLGNSGSEGPVKLQTVSSSPSKKVSVRTELIDQLEKSSRL